MARPFSSKDAQEVITGHRVIRKKLNESKSNEINLEFQIKVAVERLINAEVKRFLKEIPVEELNRDKEGIKVKLLRDTGYESVADLVGVDPKYIEAINGLGAANSKIITQKVSEFTEEAKRNTKVKLTSDNKTEESSALVNALCIYRNSRDCVRVINKLDEMYGAQIDSSITIVSPATSGLKWFFMSGSKKKKTTEAYDFLLELIYGEYGDDAKQVISIYDSVLKSGIDAWKDFDENSIEYFNILEELVPGIHGDDDLLYGLPEDLAHEIEKQTFSLEGLNCTLRKYQEWGVKYILHQERVLLGDEMGLGKTVQAIASMVALSNNGESHFLVVCPASVLSNWCREITKHSNLSVYKIHGSGRDMAKNMWLSNGGVGVTTYETTEHIALNEKYKFCMAIVDEAHYIKNPEAKRSKNVRAICEHAQRILFMTGTALENRVSEMISLIKILRPNIADKVEGMAFMSSAPQFRTEIAPVYYRRRREDVLTELPELIDMKEWCTLSANEEQAYELALLSRNYSDIRRVSWNVENISDSSKAKRLMEIIEDSKEDGRKIIVFSFFLDTISKVCELLGDSCLQPINGSVSVERRQEIIDEFDKAPAGTVLAAQIQSGGTGLNIQCASVVVLCEPQLKPSIENQAISRAYRMGQSRNVLVHRLLGDDTIDEKIMDMLNEKQAVFDAFADKSVVADESAEIDEKSLANLVKEEIERVNLKQETPSGEVDNSPENEILNNTDFTTNNQENDEESTDDSKQGDSNQDISDASNEDNKDNN